MPDETEPSQAPGPLAALGVLAGAEVAVTDQLDHLEMYTREGLLTLLWHGEADHQQVVLMVGGGMGGLLGPGQGLYHTLGAELADAGVGAIRVGYRVPNDIDRCVHDTLAAAELAARRGARSFVVMGHSFGGAVAIQAGAALGELAAGVVTFATQTGGAEAAEHLQCPLLLFHGDRDELLPHMASEMVQMISDGELVILAGAGHTLGEAEDEIHQRLRTWIPERFAEHEPPAAI
ncbi:MAG: dienelactone hydrolase family protein [Acidimicrobiales bacterium]|nr:dienelactone hydrolase family protein [Acidimicrobiales bacterium]